MEIIQLIIISFIVVLIGGVFLGPMANSVFAINHLTAYSQETNTSSADYINYTFPERIYDPATFNNSLASEQLNFTANTDVTRYLSITNMSHINTFYMDNSWLNATSPFPQNTNTTLTIGGRLITKMCYQESATTQAQCEVYCGY